jgi:hypothetical protein
MQWVKIRSWHAVKFDTRGSLHATYCGRFAAREAELLEDLPNEKSCESCLRIVAKQADES